MKKTLASVLVFVMALTLLAVPAIAEESIKLTAWAWDKNVDSLVEAARLYTELTGVNVELNVEAIAQNDIRTTLTTSYESGDLSALPDIILLEDTGFISLGASYPEAFFDVTEHVDWTQVAAAKASLTMMNGAHYGIPFDSGSSIAMYRLDVLEKAGYTLDDLKDVTWDRAIEIGADVYEKTGYYLFSDGGAILMQMITSSGVELFNEDGSANVAGNPAVIKALETVKKGVDAKAIYVASDWNDFVASFTGGTVAAGVIQGCWIANNVNTAPDQAYLWDMAAIPVLDGIDTATHYTNGGGSSWFVLSNCEHPEEAATMLGYIFAGEGMMSYIDFMTKDIGYITTYAPIASSDYYDSIDDGFYEVGFWTRVANTAAQAPIFNTSFMYTATQNALNTAREDVLAGASIEDALSTAQSTLDFEFMG
jgi:lactose/L-arabinose transport system substrate-binding protein